MRKKTLLPVCASTAALAALLFPPNTYPVPDDLFEADGGTGIIYKFTSAGTKTVFASGINGPGSLAFDASANLFVAESNAGTISKITRTGRETTLASGLN